MMGVGQLDDGRFDGIEPFKDKVWLSAPAMHGEELKWIEDAIRGNFVSTMGENIHEAEKMAAEKVGRKHCVALSSGTAAIHLSVRLAGEKLYGRPRAGHGSLEGHVALCSDLTFGATVNPVAYEGGEAVFVDCGPDDWNMDPDALSEAFERFPDAKLVVLAHLYGVPARVDKIRDICERHGAFLIEDAAESFGARYKGEWTGRFGGCAAISANGNKIITASSGGMFFTDSDKDEEKIRKWSAQSREAAPWYEHEELGYNYRMSNIAAGILRGQLSHLEEHIERKKEIYERYEAGFKGLPVKMNPYDKKDAEPNFWLSCVTIDADAMARQVRSDREALYIKEPKKSCPTQILEALAFFNVEARPIWKPMHMQPLYRANSFVPSRRAGVCRGVGEDIFDRGLCLPSDVRMTKEEQDKVIEIVRRCFI